VKEKSFKRAEKYFLIKAEKKRKTRSQWGEKSADDGKI
jgi:hypothetical protein